MGKAKKPLISEGVRRVIVLIVGAVCSTMVLMFSVLTILTISDGEYLKAPNYLIWVFVFMGLSALVAYVKKRTKYNLVRSIVLFVCNVVLGIVVLFAKENLYFFSLTAGLFCIAIALSRIIKIIEKKSLRTLIFNLILIACVGLLAGGLFIPVKAEGIGYVVLIECLFVALTALSEVASIAFSELKFKVLFKIIANTFALEILFGLLATMVAGALVLFTVESTQFATFGDALWYCFTVVTTIGFGDFAATTLVGRLISVILGLYGIIAVAVITSIIVNFYNETSGKRDVKELKSISKDEKEDNK